MSSIHSQGILGRARSGHLTSQPCPSMLSSPLGTLLPCLEALRVAHTAALTGNPLLQLSNLLFDRCWLDEMPLLQLLYCLGHASQRFDDCVLNSPVVGHGGESCVIGEGQLTLDACCSCRMLRRSCACSGRSRRHQGGSGTKSLRQLGMTERGEVIDEATWKADKSKTLQSWMDARAGGWGVA